MGIIVFVYTLLKVVGHYNVNVLSMSVMGFHKHLGWGEHYPIFWGFLGWGIF